MGTTIEERLNEANDKAKALIAKAAALGLTVEHAATGLTSINNVAIEIDFIRSPS